MDTYQRLQPDDLAQAAVVEAIFVDNTAMRDQMLPTKAATAAGTGRAAQSSAEEYHARRGSCRRRDEEARELGASSSPAFSAAKSF